MNLVIVEARLDWFYQAAMHIPVHPHYVDRESI